MKFYCGNCGAELKENQKYCNKCGEIVEIDEEEEKKIDNKAKFRSNIGNFIAIIIIIFGLIFFYNFFFENKNKNFNYNEYEELNPNVLYKDYVNNEISADEKYKSNRYFVEGEIYDIVHYISDNYIELRYTYDNDKTKTIELNAYFNDINDLKKLNKGDRITVYCEFKQRSVENWFNITSFSLINCHI